jgi:predicted acetyltransferase
MATEVRAVTAGEMGEYLGCIRTSFLTDREVTVEEAVWKAAHMDLERTFCAFVDGDLSGTARTFPTDLTVPGGQLKASAVTEVTVLPTHHRQGHLRRMMQAMLDDAVEREEPVAILTASEWPIYGRFGYGPASLRVSVEVRTAEVEFFAPRSGSVAIVGVHELRDVAPEIYERIRPETVGALSRDPEWWDLILNVEFPPGSPPAKSRVRVVWSDESGDAQGYAIYDATENWVQGHPNSELMVRELFAATAEAHRELWRYLCEVDLVGVVRANHRAVDDPLVFHLSDGRAVRTQSRLDHLWLRLLDVRGSLAARSYSAPGRVVFEVEDPTYERVSRLAVEAAGSLEEGAIRASAEATQDDAGIVIGVADLSAAYLGGVSFASLAGSGRLVERIPGTVRRADAMFSISPLPYLTTNF